VASASTAVDRPAASIEEVEAQYCVDKDLRTLILRDGRYASLSLAGAKLDYLDLRRCIFQQTTLTNASLSGVDAVRAIFTKADLREADCRYASFRDAQFNAANLTSADMRGCEFTPGTNLRGTIVKGMKIDRHALRSLGPAHGGLTDADLSELIVYDDQVKLASSFGGFWTFLHLMAVLIFLLPYIAYGVRKYIEQIMSPCIEPNCIPLREALWDYIAYAGKGIHAPYDWLAITLFTLLLLYNSFRLALVYKTRALKLTEESIGIPRRFVLSGFWSVAYYSCQILVWINLSLVLVHTYHLLSTPVHR
jgi:hypothetical protein